MTTEADRTSRIMLGRAPLASQWRKPAIVKFFPHANPDDPLSIVIDDRIAPVRFQHAMRQNAIKTALSMPMSWHPFRTGCRSRVRIPCRADRIYTSAKPVHQPPKPRHVDSTDPVTGLGR